MEVKSKMPVKPKRAIKIAYKRIMRERKGSQLGDHVKINDIFEELRESYSAFDREEIKKAMLKMFYIDGTIDLGTGKESVIEDVNGNKFAYIKLKNQVENMETFLYFAKKEGLAYAVTKGMCIETLPEGEIKEKSIELRDKLYELNDLVQKKYNIKNNLIQ